MPIDFPASPTNGQTFTDGDKTWEYSTSVGAWNLKTVAAPTVYDDQNILANQIFG